MMNLLKSKTRKIVALTSFLFSSVLLCAQKPWSSFRTDSTAFLHGGEMFSIRFDSVFSPNPGDTFYYNYVETRQKSPLPGACQLKVKDTSWVGPLVKTLSNSHDYSYNRWGDSVLFIGALALGDSYVMYRYSDSSYIEARCVGDQGEELLEGLFEGTKTFRMQAKTKVGDDTANIFNGRLFKITYLHGFKLAYPWWLFPTDTTEIWLAGLAADTSRGFLNTSSSAIFNIQPGNEFHYNIHHEFCGFSGCRTETIREKRFYLSRDTSVTDDSVTLSYQRISINHIDDPITGLDTIYTIDTQQQVISFTAHAYLDGFNREDFHADSIMGTLCNCPTHGYSIISFTDSLGPRPRKHLFLDLELDTANACLYPSANTGYDSTFVEYGDGLGLTRFRDTDNNTEWHRLDLVYYQKGIEFWGEPIDFSEVTVVEEPANQVQLYPNPVENMIHITASDEQVQNVELLNATGSVMRAYAYPGNTGIDVSDLGAGFYLARITTSNGAFVARFVKLSGL